MKIALIARIFDPGRGGLERFHVNLAHMLADRGIDVTVFAEKLFSPAKTNIHWTPVKSGKNILAPNSVKFAAAVQKVLNPADFDCVLANTPYFPCDIHRAGGGIHKMWYKMREAEKGGVNKIAGFMPQRRYALSLEKKVYDPAKVYIQVANSRLVKAQMIQYYGFPENRIAVVYNGVDFDLFDLSWCEENRKRLRVEMNFSEKDFVILFPSNNFKRKGLGVLIDAVKQAKISRNLLILAVGQDRWKTENIRIRFAGYQKNMLPYYAVSDCLILPSMYEPCSNVVLEAMACGKVCVTSPTNGASEFIDHGENGFVLNSWKDINQLKMVLEQLYSDSRQTKEMGQKAFESVKKYTLEKNTDRIIMLFNRVMETKKA